MIVAISSLLVACAARATGAARPIARTDARPPRSERIHDEEAVRAPAPTGPAARSVPLVRVQLDVGPVRTILRRGWPWDVSDAVLTIPGILTTPIDLPGLAPGCQEASPKDLDGPRNAAVAIVCYWAGWGDYLEMVPDGEDWAIRVWGQREQLTRDVPPREHDRVVGRFRAPRDARFEVVIVAPPGR